MQSQQQFSQFQFNQQPQQFSQFNSAMANPNPQYGRPTYPVSNNASPNRLTKSANNTHDAEFASLKW